MRRYLVVANQTLQRAELRDELRERIGAGPSSFYLLVPDTRAADYPDVAATASVLQPSMTWWMTDYRGPATDEEASTRPGNGSARCWLTWMRWVSPLRATWEVPSLWRPWRRCSPITGSMRSSAAMLPQPVSRWLRADLPHRAERRFGLPVMTIITKRGPEQRAARTRTSTGSPGAAALTRPLWRSCVVESVG